MTDLDAPGPGTSSDGEPWPPPSFEPGSGRMRPAGEAVPRTASPVAGASRAEAPESTPEGPAPEGPAPERPTGTAPGQPSAPADATPPTPSRRARRKERAARKAAERSGGMTALRETVIVLLSALAVSFVIKTFLVQAFYIPSESMESTLEVGDRVLVSRLAPGPLDLHRGDIVVFVDPGGWLDTAETASNPVRDALITAGEWVGLLPANTGSHLIKRVIGLPGDHVTCCDAEGRISVNGTPIDEPYVIDGAVPSKERFDVVVPEGRLFVLGDNRSNSGDSRFHLGDPGGGMVPMDDVVGVAQVRMWPLDRLGLLRNPGETFVEVPDPAP